MDIPDRDPNPPAYPTRYRDDRDGDDWRIKQRENQTEEESAESREDGQDD